MEMWIWGIIGAVAIVVIIVVDALGKPKIRKAMSEVASQFGFTFRRGSFFSEPAIEGEYERHPVEIFLETIEAEIYTVISLVNPHNKLYGYYIGPEQFLSQIVKNVGFNDVLTGDAAFDSQILIKGKEHDVLARVDSAARSMILDLLSYANQRNLLQIKDSEIRFAMPGTILQTGKLLGYPLDQMVRLSKHLLRPGLNQELLAYNCQNDPVPQARHRNFEALSQCYPDHQLVQQGIFPY